MDAARFDLAEVCKERREELIRATDDPACTGQQLVVGKLGKFAETVRCRGEIRHRHDSHLTP
jgi:hypothetical protein